MMKYTMKDLPDWAKDVVVNNTVFHFSFPDRIRLLFGWNLHLDTATATEGIPGKTEVTNSRLWFEPPRWIPRKKRFGYEEVNP